MIKPLFILRKKIHISHDMLDVMDNWKCTSHIAAHIDNIIKNQISLLLLFPCLKGNNPNNQLQLAK